MLRISTCLLLTAYAGAFAPTLMVGNGLKQAPVYPMGLRAGLSVSHARQGAARLHMSVNPSTTVRCNLNPLEFDGDHCHDPLVHSLSCEFSFNCHGYSSGGEESQVKDQ